MNFLVHTDDTSFNPAAKANDPRRLVPIAKTRPDERSCD